MTRKGAVGRKLPAFPHYKTNQEQRRECVSDTDAVRSGEADAADLFQPVRGDDGDSFGQSAQELDGPANLVGHQAGHVGHALRHAAP